MKIGTITLLVLLAFTALSSAAYAEGEIYKIVNPDGSVTFTDQKPSPGAEPVQLKPLSVVETETPPAPAAPATASAPASTEPTERDLRRMYSDFSITQHIIRGSIQLCLQHNADADTEIHMIPTR